jgi:alginate O-acetyltransferase complex protein AlgI
MGMFRQPLLQAGFLDLLGRHRADGRFPGHLQISEFFDGLMVARPEPQSSVLGKQFFAAGYFLFTFEFVHYAVDRYRNKTASGRLANNSRSSCFFPPWLPGRSSAMRISYPSSAAFPVNRLSTGQRGFTLILAGLAKKFVIADFLTSYTNHLNYADISRANRAVLPLWLLAYGIKIYVDFSAYSDIAIGSARLFGIQVPENFDWPYARTNIAEFWRHWHISLTNWLIDHIYIPLGGSRVSTGRVYGNIIVTMLISGIWYGAGVNFIVWGSCHGVMLAIHRVFILLYPPGPRAW